MHKLLFYYNFYFYLSISNLLKVNIFLFKIYIKI